MVTADTNIAFYALQQSSKTERAEAALARAHFLSAQVLNEYAAASRRKLRLEWARIARDVELLQEWVQNIRPIDAPANREALRLSQRYDLPFYDALIVAVALAGGATTLYTEDMQHGLVIDNRLKLLNPFVEAGISDG